MERKELLALMVKELPRLLQEHPEARYQLIGILAEVFARRDEFQEILSSIREIIQRQEEHSRILQEHTLTLREHSRILEEHTRTLQEHSRTIERHSQILQEHTSAIRSLIEQQQRLTEEVAKMGRTLSAVGARWGYLAEEAFRQGLEAVVAERLGLKVEKWRWWDEEGFVFGRPDWIEVDVAIHDDEHILVQISSSATRGEIAAFYRIGQLYERLKGVKPHLLFVAVFLDERAKELAQKLGIEVRTAP
jgi:hypothetical protein